MSRKISMITMITTLAMTAIVDNGEVEEAAEQEREVHAVREQLVVGLAPDQPSSQVAKRLDDAGDRLHERSDRGQGRASRQQDDADHHGDDDDIDRDGGGRP